MPARSHPWWRRLATLGIGLGQRPGSTVAMPTGTGTIADQRRRARVPSPEGPSGAPEPAGPGHAPGQPLPGRALPVLPMAAVDEAPHTARRARPGGCPLDACPVGILATVCQVRCAAEDATRLRDLGIFEGARVAVVSDRNGVVLDVHGARLALDPGAAHQVLVEAPLGAAPAG